MRNIFEGDAYNDKYKALTNEIRQALLPIFEKHQEQGYSKKGVGLAVISVVNAMVPALGDDVEPLKYEGGDDGHKVEQERTIRPWQNNI